VEEVFSLQEGKLHVFYCCVVDPAPWLFCRIRIHGSFLQDPDSEFFTQNENKFKHLHIWLEKC
jgi:hypothetical protein